MPRFLCCLPLSVGVWLFSLLFFAWGTVLTIIGWYGVAQYNQTDLALTRRQLVSLIITTSSWTILPVVTLFGMGAALARSPRALKAYSTGLWFQFGFSVGAGAYFIYSLFRRNNNGTFITDCTARNVASQDTCREAFNVLRGVIVAVYIVIWLIQIWGGVIVTQYATERFSKSGPQFSNAPAPQAPFAPLDPLMMPPPEPPILGPAPPGRFGPNASGRFTPPGGTPPGGVPQAQPQPAFAPGAAGVTLPPIIPLGQTAPPPGTYAFAMPQNAHGPGAANQV